MGPPVCSTNRASLVSRLVGPAPQEVGEQHGGGSGACRHVTATLEELLDVGVREAPQLAHLQSA